MYGMIESMGGTVEFPAFRGMKRITDMKREYFVANYYGINPFSASRKYVLALSTDARDYLPGIDDPAEVGLVDIDTGEFTPVSVTRAWNFQEGCMAHWLGTSPDSEIIFNDFVGERYVSRIIGIDSGKERVICRPVSSVAPDGRKAVSLNYARRRLTRPDYGYDGRGEDPRENSPFPDDDGLFLVDLEKNTSRLIVSVAGVKKMLGIPPGTEDNALMWFAHTLFSRNGSRIFFLARIRKKQGWHTAALTVGPDGTGLRPCFPSPWEWGGSHYDWYSDNVLMVTAMFGKGKYVPVIFTDGGDDYRVLGRGLFGDGHGTFSPDGRFMAIDTYPDEFGYQDLCLMEMTTDAVLPLGSLYQPPGFSRSPGHWRCDLHPHWSPRGDCLLVNSTFENKRQVYMLQFEDVKTGVQCKSG